jgi:hypothetical protein
MSPEKNNERKLFGSKILPNSILVKPDLKKSYDTSEN